MTRREMFLFAAALAMPASRAAAQCTAPTPTVTTATITGLGRSCSTTGTTLNAVTLPRLGAIVALGGATGTTFDFGVASAADYDAGFKDLAATIAVQSNRPFELRFRGLNATWTAVNDATYGTGVAAWSAKPVSDLAGATAAGGPWGALSTATDLAVPSAAGDFIGGAAKAIWLRVYLDWGSDTPAASYTLNNVQITLYLN
ncbi:MAG TPA: hypothetical protein VGD77_00870 [Gemmatimonadaceae bacterium]